MFRVPYTVKMNLTIGKHSDHKNKHNATKCFAKCSKCTTTMFVASAGGGSGLDLSKSSYKYAESAETGVRGALMHRSIPVQLCTTKYVALRVHGSRSAQIGLRWREPGTRQAHGA